MENKPQYLKSQNTYIDTQNQIVFSMNERRGFELVFTRSELNSWNLDYCVPISQTLFQTELKHALEKVKSMLLSLQLQRLYNVVDSDGTLHEIMAHDIKSCLLQCFDKKIMVQNIVNLQEYE